MDRPRPPSARDAALRHNCGVANPWPWRHDDAIMSAGWVRAKRRERRMNVVAAGGVKEEFFYGNVEAWNKGVVVTSWSCSISSVCCCVRKHGGCGGEWEFEVIQYAITHWEWFLCDSHPSQVKNLQKILMYWYSWWCMEDDWKIQNVIYCACETKWPYHSRWVCGCFGLLNTESILGTGT